MESRIFTYLFFLSSISLIFVGIVDAQLADSPWPMFHGSASHGGQSKYDTSHIDGTIKWIFETGDGIESSPVIGKDSTIYFGSHDTFLYAVNPNGTLKWKFDMGEQHYDENYGGTLKSTMGSPAIAEDGTIYVFSAANYLFAVNPDGTERWRFYIKWGTDFWSAPMVGADGTIYLGSARVEEASFDAGLYAINPDGTEKWHYSQETGITTPPTIGKDGTIYIGEGVMSEDKSKEDAGNIVALTPGGKVKWKFLVKLWVEGASTVTDDVLYAVTKEGDIYSHGT